jgi:hypothetical protein
LFLEKFFKFFFEIFFKICLKFVLKFFNLFFKAYNFVITGSFPTKSSTNGNEIRQLVHRPGFPSGFIKSSRPFSGLRFLGPCQTNAPVRSQKNKKMWKWNSAWIILGPGFVGIEADSACPNRRQSEGMFIQTLDISFFIWCTTKFTSCWRTCLLCIYLIKIQDPCLKHLLIIKQVLGTRICLQ